ncbi:unnamed protein product [Darwinula stevensoni]|uniref:Uncharacterized protein n=1 Tax=Darwinula stevensoni TaxID=69355 RepID=A0A7R9ABK7_9CRUS|nr:unnamed protein product [Darwinula stevensoni]CAG0899267.1 unnamed protein product [Darwinula stevensoni]
MLNAQSHELGHKLGEEAGDSLVLGQGKYSIQSWTRVKQIAQPCTPVAMLHGILGLHMAHFATLSSVYQDLSLSGYQDSNNPNAMFYLGGKMEQQLRLPHWLRMLLMVYPFLRWLLFQILLLLYLLRLDVAPVPGELFKNCGPSSRTAYSLNLDEVNYVSEYNHSVLPISLPNPISSREGRHRDLVQGYATCGPHVAR